MVDKCATQQKDERLDSLPRSGHSAVPASVCPAAGASPPTGIHRMLAVLSSSVAQPAPISVPPDDGLRHDWKHAEVQSGRASCRAKVCQYVVISLEYVHGKKKKQQQPHNTHTIH